MQRFRLETTAAALTLVAVACSESAGPRLRVGTNPWPGYQILTLAEQTGCFDRHGLEVQIVEFESLHDLVAAFDRGDIDLMPGTLAEVLAVQGLGHRQPEIVFVTDASDGADVVLARDVEKARDLRGAAIGYEQGALGSYMLSRLLDHAGLRADEVRPVVMHQQRMLAAMQGERVDAVIAYPPASDAVQALPGTHVVFSTADIPGEVIDVVAADRSLLDAQPELLERFHAALADAFEFQRNHREEARRIMASSCGIEPAEWDEATQGMRFYDSTHQLDWLWGGDRLTTITRRLQVVLESSGVVKVAVPEHLTPARRPIPSTLSPAVPR